MVDNNQHKLFNLIEISINFRNKDFQNNKYFLYEKNLPNYIFLLNEVYKDGKDIKKNKLLNYLLALLIFN